MITVFSRMNGEFQYLVKEK